MPACLDPGPSGGRAHWVVCHLLPSWILAPPEGGPIGLSVIFYRHIACHGEAASPGAGSAVYPTLQEVSFILSTGNAVIGKIGGMQGFFLIRNNVLKKNHACMPT